MRRFALVALAGALALSSCAKCGAKGKPDAGPATRRAIDLRTAMMAALPEWRGIEIEDGRAVLRREVEGPFDAAEVKRAFEANGFESGEGDGGVRGKRDRFVLWAEPGAIEWRLPLQPDDPDRIVASPTAMSTEHMANWFPKDLGEERAEAFTLMLQYRGSAERVAFLTRQLFELSTHGTWSVTVWPGWPDGGEQPAQFRYALHDRALGADLECVRDGEHVTVTYRLVTFERK